MKSNTQKITLTQDQQAAYDKFQGFLLSNQTEFHLFGAAGCGKTFLVRHFLTQGLKDYKRACKLIGKEPINTKQIYLTATTNKAVEVLQQTITNQNKYFIETIYKTFNVTVENDLTTGNTVLVLKDSNYFVEDSLIFIDECSMLPEQMIQIIRSHTRNCKVVYIGDNYQLAPVNENPHWDHTPNLTTAHLLVPVRNKNQQALVDLCDQLRTTVKTLEFKPIKLVSGIIEQLDDNQALQWINQADYSKNRILSYTNSKSLKYTELIKQQRGISSSLQEGELYINNSYFHSNKNVNFYPEELVRITNIKGPAVKKLGICKSIPLEVYTVEIESVNTPGKKEKGYAVKDPLTYRRLLRQLAKDRIWVDYFWLTGKILDLRLSFACTVHKAQGNTYDEVLIDCGSFRVCDDPATAARLLYVAVSRAKNKVLFYGKLPKKYGELI